MTARLADLDRLRDHMDSCARSLAIVISTRAKNDDGVIQVDRGLADLIGTFDTAETAYLDALRPEPGFVKRRLEGVAEAVASS